MSILPVSHKAQEYRERAWIMANSPMWHPDRWARISRNVIELLQIADWLDELVVLRSMAMSVASYGMQEFDYRMERAVDEGDFDAAVVYATAKSDSYELFDYAFDCGK